jgi:RHS repeat-associated protein
MGSSSPFNPPDYDREFVYDRMGNRLKETVRGLPALAYSPNSLCQYDHVGDRSYDYDQNGNLATEREKGTVRRAFLHDHNNCPGEVSEAGQLIRIRYDALGRRVWQQSGNEESLLLYDGHDSLAEYRHSDQKEPFKPAARTISEAVIDGHVAIMSNEKGREEGYWYHKDLIGSTRMLSDGGGKRISLYEYTPFGQLSHSHITKKIEASTSMFSRRLLIGARELYDFRKRTYDAAMRRFLQREPAGRLEPPNLYQYARNSPLMRIDPTGELDETAGDQALGGPAGELRIAWRRMHNEKGFWKKAGATGLAEAWLVVGAVGAVPWTIERPSIVVRDAAAGVDQTFGWENVDNFTVSLQFSAPPAGAVTNGLRWVARLRFSSATTEVLVGGSKLLG